MEDGLHEIEQALQWKIFANKVENKRSQRTFIQIWYRSMIGIFGHMH